MFKPWACSVRNIFYLQKAISQTWDRKPQTVNVCSSSTRGLWGDGTSESRGAHCAEGREIDRSNATPSLSQILLQNGCWGGSASGMHSRLALVLSLSTACALADGPADNQADKVRRIPPPGIVISDDARRELSDGARQLGGEIEAARSEFAKMPLQLARLPDVQIFQKAVDWALRYDEFYSTNEVAAARAQLDMGRQRLASLREGKTPWLMQSGPVALGYVSRIDGSVQPYGLVIPHGAVLGGGHPYRLDLWFHGRGEKLSELSFVQDRSRNPGEFVPANAFVLHPYGRYCNGSRFAGEVDAWEALADVQQRFPIDENRLVDRGFSLGGAACWHMATHHAWRWAAAAPGAGFSETAEFLKVFQNETLQPAWWEQKLWRMYDATDHALNVSMVPLVAYSGEKDRQKQAADAMALAMERENLELTHIIGPNTEHRYEPQAKAEVNRRIDAAVARGRDPLPRTVRFVTHTLRYNRMAWVKVDGMEQHWEPARVEATFNSRGGVSLVTKNVTALTLDVGPGLWPFDPRDGVDVELDGVVVKAGRPGSDRSWVASFQREGGTWELGELPGDSLRKRPGLQGPIDDAFMDSFLFVAPGGKSASEAVNAFVAREMAHAVEQWRSHYRGDARRKGAGEVTDADLAAHNLVLWGDPESNALIARIADKLPVKWKDGMMLAGGKSYAAAQHLPVLIFPNPLNPKRYVVLNSGFTFREYDYLNNARQTSKLPDWAVLDVSKPGNARVPAPIVDGGFFGEKWEWRAR